ncbi:hypothetical protein Q669_27960 [Labrenzia sp. C1B10]|nr:hypothetical protein Q669_27960 [Labrenzia sp. C1B10]
MYAAGLRNEYSTSFPPSIKKRNGKEIEDAGYYVYSLANVTQMKLLERFAGLRNKKEFLEFC